MANGFDTQSKGANFGYAPSGLPQGPDALSFLTHAPGAFSQAGHNLAVQAWAGFNLLNSEHTRLTAHETPIGAETALALGGNYMRMF